MPNKIYVYKLNFSAPLHFGANKAGIGLEANSLNAGADTLFSALCNELLMLQGEEKLEEFIKIAKSDDFFISDLFPYDNDELYIPKPILFFEDSKKRKDEKRDNSKDSSNDKKTAKKISFIPLSKLDFYIEYLRGLKEDIKDLKKDFSLEHTYSKVALPRNKKKDENNKEDENELYSVSVNIFKQDCGLYFVAILKDDKQKKELDEILKSLQYSGIGGKRSSGYGKFCLKNSNNNQELEKLINSKSEKKFYMSLSSIYPTSKDLDKFDSNSFYKIIPSRGFIYSKSYSKTPLKRKSIYLISSGSCFKKRLQGSIVDVSNGGKHPVYRYAKALMIGLENV